MTESIPGARREDLHVETHDFWSRQVGVLEGRDPLEVLAHTPDELRRVVDKHPPEAFRSRPEPDGWSPAEVLGHLTQVEWAFGYRCRVILAEERPEFDEIDQDRWVAARGWRDVGPSEIVDQFAALRGVSLAFWRDLGAEEMARDGFHRGAGVRLRLDQMRDILAGHDLVHLRQIREGLSCDGSIAS